MHMRYSFKTATRKPRIALTMHNNTNPLKTRQKVVATKPTGPTQKISVLRHLVAKSWITCRSRSWFGNIWIRLPTRYSLFPLRLPHLHVFLNTCMAAGVSTIYHTVHNWHILSVKLLLGGDADKNQTSARSSIHVSVS
jgi:hypothetical protein